ncbi:MAG: hypothetical protein ABII00_05655 [Elusimicrobiota bacterium]
MFHSYFFGENPGQPFGIDPDVSDHQESWSRHGSHARVGTKPAADQPPSEAAPERPVFENRPVPRVDRTRVPAHRKWPGPHRPVSAGGAEEDAGLSVEKGEDLRDAPAAVNPGNYSLWAGLSRPLLLPSSKVGDVPLDRAKDLGREDYEQHILGSGSGDTSGPISLKDLPVAGLPSPMGRDLGSGEGKDQFVVVELDIARTPGEFKDAVAELTEAAGFRMDERFAPAFMGADRGRVALQGWLPADRTGDLMALERVVRLETGSSHPSAGGRATGGRTDLLLGIRIPPESSPNTALKETVARLSAGTGFEFRKAIAYQRIPGTSRMVLVISGQVPVRDIGRLMADPAVVKVLPRPGDGASASLERVSGKKKVRRQGSLLARFLAFAMEDHPVSFLAVFLITMFLIGPNLLGERGGSSELTAYGAAFSSAGRGEDGRAPLS